MVWRLEYRSIYDYAAVTIHTPELTQMHLHSNFVIYILLIQLTMTVIARKKVVHLDVVWIRQAPSLFQEQYPNIGVMVQQSPLVISVVMVYLTLLWVHML